MARLATTDPDGRGFVDDDDVNRVLGVDGIDEAARCFSSDDRVPGGVCAPRRLELESVEEVERYRGDGGWENARFGIPDKVFLRRGSIRDFSPEAISRDDLAAILGGATGTISLDVLVGCQTRIRGTNAVICRWNRVYAPHRLLVRRYRAEDRHR